MNLDNTFQNLARRVGKKFDDKTIERHWNALVRAAGNRRDRRLADIDSARAATATASNE